MHEPIHAGISDARRVRATRLVGRRFSGMGALGLVQAVPTPHAFFDDRTRYPNPHALGFYAC